MLQIEKEMDKLAPHTSKYKKFDQKLYIVFDVF